MSSTIKEAKELSKYFYAAADELDRHHRNVNVVRLMGGAAAGVALLAIPFTAGSSVSLLGWATFGLTVSGGASVVGYHLKKSTMDTMEDKWRVFMKNFVEKLEGKDYVVSMRADELWVQCALKVLGILEVALSKHPNAPKRNDAMKEPGTARGRQIWERVQYVVLQGVAIHTIVDASVKLHKEQESPAGMLLRQLAAELQTIAEMPKEEGYVSKLQKMNMD